jgi:hypothetical protein
MRSVFTILVLLLLALSPLGAQQSGQIDYPQLGLSFTIPEGWIGQGVEGMYMLGHNNIPGFILLIPHPTSLTTEQMLAEARAGLNLGAGSQLVPTGMVQAIGEGQVGGEFQGTVEYSPAKAYIIGMANPHGNGLTIIALTSTAAYQAPTYRELAEAVRDGVLFSPVKAAASTAPPGATTGTLADWKYQLGGTRLTFKESYYSGGDVGGGYNLETEIHLCTAGYFLFYDQSMVSAGNASVNAYSGGNNQGHGNWDIVEQGGAFVLVLNFQNGTQKTFQLAWGEEQKLFLNGNRYYRTWTGEYAPNCGE